MITGIADIIVISITSVTPGSKMKKGSVAKGVIVRTRSKIVRPDGSFVKFDDNAIVLVDKDGEPIATRVFGPVAREVRQKNFLKIASLASEVL
jgi:large subunit ribosomal protein L14